MSNIGYYISFLDRYYTGAEVTNMFLGDTNESLYHKAVTH